MEGKEKKSGKQNEKVVIDCAECTSQADCCRFGAWVDLEEAKKIASLKLKGVFYHLEPDPDFPSGYKVGTSYEDERCTFLDPDGLCSVHKVDLSLKPVSCKEFPYENNSLSPFVEELCTVYKQMLKKGEKAGSGSGCVARR
jgi:Fe-S-cluster containining protein